MDTKLLYKGFGILSFITALIVYLLTIQPSVPFWDCGEFSAASIWQQVPHPPGAPLFLMIGKLFSLIIPFGDLGWRVNVVSVVASSATVFFLYLIAVKVIRNYRKDPIDNVSDALAVYGSAFVGSLALIFSDTFWFNAVESEVYAFSAFLVAIIVYLMMRWNEEADNPGHERYLLLIAYIMGLSTGVHLLSILAVFSIVFLVYFRKYELKPSSFIMTGIISVFILFIIYPGIVKWFPSMLAGHLPIKNDCREYVVESPMNSVLVVLFIIAAVVGLWYGYKRNMNTLNLICSTFILMIIGYSTYTQILIRSNANPPMNENEPKNLVSLTSYLGREQYGDAPEWPRRYHPNDDYYTRWYNMKDESGNYVYGEWIPPSRVDVKCNDGRYITIPKFKKTNFIGEIMYMWKYQINHMYIRYFNWNFIGRSTDIQDGDWTFYDTSDAKRMNIDSGYASMYPIRFFALPLILGLIGLVFHFYKDPKMAFIYLTMFLMMGVITAMYQNQQKPQPRERDYFYAGSFFVFCMWIGLGTYYLIKGMTERKLGTGIVAGIVLASIILVPVNMAYNGWELHDRAGNFLPFDYSYNILQSTEKDAIIFTNGDNDTFPLWYLQDVEGVRRDVRVVNLSLGNTLWYVDQIKNREPWGAKKVPLSFADDSLRVEETSPMALSYDFGEALNVSIPIDRDILEKYTNDPAILKKGTWDFTFIGKKYTERNNKTIYLYRVQDKLILDILRQTRLRRPVYFSVTVGPESYCGLDSYFRAEGMAMKICPVPQKSSGMEAINPDVMEACLMNVDNSDNYSLGPKYGFKFRNLNNMNVFYDEVHRRLMLTYRRIFLTYASWALSDKKDSKKAVEILDVMNKNISPVQFPLTFEMEYQVAQMYYDAGAKEKFKNFALGGIKRSMNLINDHSLRPEIISYELQGRYFGPYRRTARLYELLEDYKSALSVQEKFHSAIEQEFIKFQNNPAYAQEAQKIRQNLIDVEANMDENRVMVIKGEQGPKAALDSALKIYAEYSNSQDYVKQYFGSYIKRRINELRAELGIKEDSAQTGTVIQ